VVVILKLYGRSKISVRNSSEEKKKSPNTARQSRLALELLLQHLVIQHEPVAEF
jgi:hypothetical protein